MTTTDARNLGAADIEALLPWHAAGTLDRGEAEAVERALAENPELARRFALVREELAETIRVNESLGAPSSRAMNTLIAAIAAEEAGARGPPGRSLDSRSLGFRSLGARMLGLLGRLSPRATAWAGAAAAVVIVAQAGVITALLLGGEGGLDGDGATAGRPGSLALSSVPTRSLSAAREDATVFVLVRFAPEARATDIARVLRGHRAAIVEGPKAGGLYRLRLAGGSRPGEETARLLDALQAERDVIGFAARAD
ncbi:hypothetical protein A33M_0047 [Rhodovulum sp. PH10]|uniref:hypothetical protein n=1 Tax=Rhodovulum sp. PH10 TaxID=1187851 RepID=UPI00027C25B4|nr:hypothetical protein [Rhodovulum sp. PH10]EJW13717.1 hypothetical protein A33M_0047 [Rhodovulum sp. PH10]